MPPLPHAAASPAAAAFRRIGSGLVTLVTRMETWSEANQQRRELGALSDHMLRDIGFSRADVDAERHRRFWDVQPRDPRRR